MILTLQNDRNNTNEGFIFFFLIYILSDHAVKILESNSIVQNKF